MQIEAPMHIGFTGTQKGMTAEQHSRLAHILVDLLAAANGTVTLHHGDCIGADLQAHALFHELVDGGLPICRIVIHPGDNKEKRAHASNNWRYQKVATKVLEEKDNMDRNQDIVDASDVVIAAPRSHAETRRSGTWATARRARTAGKRVIVVYPDGQFNSDWV